MFWSDDKRTIIRSRRHKLKLSQKKYKIILESKLKVSQASDNWLANLKFLQQQAIYQYYVLADLQITSSNFNVSTIQSFNVFFFFVFVFVLVL